MVGSYTAGISRRTQSANASWICKTGGRTEGKWVGLAKSNNWIKNVY